MLSGHDLKVCGVFSVSTDGVLEEMVCWLRWCAGRDGVLAEMVCWQRWCAGRDGIAG